MNCTQPGCAGEIVDGYCNVCGTAPRREQARQAPQGPDQSAAAPSQSGVPSRSGLISTEAARSSTTTARRATTRTSGSHRSRLGAGLVEVPPTAYRDPQSAVMAEPNVAEGRRFCSRCSEPVGRSRDGAPGRSEGFCRNCGARFSFAPKLVAGDVLASQYQVVGCLAHGGMGWIYLAKDRNVSDRWVVLKGLLNTGDDDAMAAALAERRFLAEVEHPNIVKIFNFVQHENSGYIVMEYVGGTSLRELMTSRRQAAGGTPAPLPVAQAVAYMLEILPALGFLHRSGLLFCDFKLDNVIQTQHSLKLIDLGGVYQVGDASSPVYGTVGYQAPEIAESGPSIPSDLFTVARTLTLLCIDFKGYQSTFKYTLPPQDEVPLFGRFDSLYRFLLKGTAPNPDDRFQSAEEMADQLFGVLREVVAADGQPVPAVSTLFTGDFHADPDRPDWRLLPALRVDTDDPAAGFLATLSAADPGGVIALLRNAPQRTVEVELRLARELIGAGDWESAEEQIAKIETDDAWEWRAGWCRGLADLARDRHASASQSFMGVYAAVPGELAPKLALAIAAECAGDAAAALPWYDVVSRTDPAYTTASLGLARVCLATGDHAGALGAYGRVLESSSSYLDAQTAIIRCHITRSDAHAPELGDLRAAAGALETIKLDGEQRARLTAELLRAALELFAQGRLAPDRDTRLVGLRLVERDLRLGLERSYRDLARRAADGRERIRLVDSANAVRPRTWT
jgi:serine/threonine-protein kinase PknG